MTQHHPHAKHSTAQILWLTDLHFDRVSDANRKSILEELQTKLYSAALITGDIASAACLTHHLADLAAACNPRPLYFVLGNHDFHGATVESCHRKVADLCRETKNLTHLNDMGAVPIGKNCILVGHNGWADARAGWGPNTVVPNPDHRAIEDFKYLRIDQCFQKMQQLGTSSTRSIRNALRAKAHLNKRVIIATHVPPFRSSTLYNGKPCGPCHLPHYINASLGGMMIATARNYPKTEFKILSGHTHNEVNNKILTNLSSLVGRPSASVVLNV